MQAETLLFLSGAVCKLWFLFKNMGSTPPGLTLFEATSISLVLRRALDCSFFQVVADA